MRDSREYAVRKELEEQLEDETKKRSALSKAMSSDKRKSSKEIEMELISTDRVIAKIKENIGILDSNDSEKIGMLLQKIETKDIDTKGHFLNSKQFFKPTDCAICHETLLDSKNQGFECSSMFFLHSMQDDMS